MSDTDKEVRVGLIGFGLAGALFHAPLIAATHGLRIAAVVTSNTDRADRAQRDHAGVRVFQAADQLWEHAAELELVVIASPNRTHVPLAQAALRAGLPVVVDKPLATTAAEGRQLIDEARQRQLMLTVFQNRRWDGDFLTVQRLLAEGSLGEPLRFESRFERWRPSPKAGWRQAGAPEDAGGVLYDLGSHLIDQALVLFGPVRHVYAELDPRYPGAEVDNDAFVALTHESGVRSHVWMSSVAAQSGPRFRVLGSQAAFTKHGLDPQEAALHAGARPGDPGWAREPSHQWGLVGAGDDLHPVPTEAGEYEWFYAGVAAALRNGTPPPVDPADAVAALKIIQAAHRSAAEGRGVSL